MDKNGHLKLSDFGLCKTLEKYSSILLEDDDLLAQDPRNEGDGNTGEYTAPWLMAKEQLLQWKRNRRALVYFFPSFICNMNFLLAFFSALYLQNIIYDADTLTCRHILLLELLITWHLRSY